MTRLSFPPSRRRDPDPIGWLALTGWTLFLGLLLFLGLSVGGWR